MTKILLVDDSEDVLEVFQESIHAIDKNIVLDLASNGEEALSMFLSSPYSMIITDYIMPKMNGVVLTKKVRALDRNIPIILITGYIESLDDGINLDLNTTVLRKPVSIKHLTEIIKGVLHLDTIRTSKILIVDDSSVSRFVLASILRKKAYVVIEADSGGDCLDKLKRFLDVDVVLTDYEMPGMNGLELARQIRSIGLQTKIVMVSASHKIDTEELKKAGILALIHKPYREECIHDTVEILLKAV